MLYLYVHGVACKFFFNQPLHVWFSSSRQHWSNYFPFSWINLSLFLYLSLCTSMHGFTFRHYFIILFYFHFGPLWFHRECSVATFSTQGALFVIWSYQLFSPWPLLCWKNCDIILQMASLTLCHYLCISGPRPNAFSGSKEANNASPYQPVPIWWDHSRHQQF